VGTPYISDRRKAALISPRRLSAMDVCLANSPAGAIAGPVPLLAPTINQADPVRRDNNDPDSPPSRLPPTEVARDR
jgi:hypothetical protein